MAPIPTTNTKRLFLDYRGEFGQHTVQFRVPPSGDEDGFCDVMQLALQGAAGLWSLNTLFYQWRLAVAGSTVTNIFRSINIAGTAGNNISPTDYPRFFSFVGRSPSGRRAKWSWYGAQFTLEGDYRLEPGDNASIFALRGALAGIAADFNLVVVDNTPPLIQPYANVGFNAYFQRQRRRQGP